MGGGNNKVTGVQETKETSDSGGSDHLLCLFVYLCSPGKKVAGVE
jgi:hypothetical protein